MLLTIGHSNRAIAEFLEMLQAHQVDLVVDVRRVPRSRHNPQFAMDRLPLSLSAVGIGYEHMPGMGGLRHPRRDSPNMGWKNKSFRGYADYMQTPEFARNLQHLRDLEAGRTVAIMCAEAVPWRCHRSLIADALVASGAPVGHILSSTKVEPHHMTAFGKIEDGRVHYPSPDLTLFR